jgi:ABC-type sugar transport system permease subunit
MALNEIIHTRKFRKKIFVASFLILPIINFLVFWLYVHLDSFLLAFKTLEDGNEVLSFVQFENIWKSLTQGTNLIDGFKIGTAFKNTMLFFGAGILVIFPLSILASYFIYKKIVGYRFFRVITYLPSIVTSAALVMMYRYLIDHGGLMHKIFQLTNPADAVYQAPLTDPSTAIWTILLYNIICGLGGNIVIMGGAMNSLSPEMLEAGEIDGCNWVQELIYLVIPGIWPTLSTIIILSTAACLGSTGPILAFTKGAQETETLAYVMYHLTLKGRTFLYLPSAIGIVMTVITVPIVFTVRKLLTPNDE